MKNKEKKYGKFCFMIIGILIALLLLVVAGFVIFDRVRHGGFYRVAEREFSIPGLSEHFTPQGFDYLEDQQLWLCCGYMSDGSASRIYTIDAEGVASTPIFIQTSDGSAHTGHAGGITHFEDYVYLADDGACYLFSLSDILDGNDTATILDHIDLPIEPAYCTVRGNLLYTGSFYYPKNYETPENERMTTPAGDQNTSLLLVYPLDSATGLPSQAQPIAVYSTPDMVQGVTFLDNETIVLSTSWGLHTSHLLLYDLSNAAMGSYSLDEYEIPLYYLDSSNQIQSISAPCMAEEIVYRDGRIYIMNESACKKYWFGNLLGASMVYSYPISGKESDRKE